MRTADSGTIKFIFQPAEEGPPPGEEGGAALMIKEGALENPRPQAIFGLHVMPNFEVGQIGYNSGPAMASADRFVVTVKGKKVHGAYPHDGVDAVVVAAECVSALQTIRSRRINTQEPLVSERRHNPGRKPVQHHSRRGEVGRDRPHAERRGAQEREGDDASDAGGRNCRLRRKFDMQYVENAAVTYNEPKLVEESLPTIKRIVGEAQVVAPKPQMGAEDFSYFQRVIPGFFYFLGVGNKAKGITAMIHTPEFDVDEESLVIGVKVMSNVLLDYLDRHAKAGQ